MTKREFYIFKTILFALSTISIYYYIIFIEKYGIKIFEEPVPFITIGVSSFLILLLLYFLFSERPLTIEEIEEEKREEEEDNKRYELEQKELLEKAKQRNRELLPVVEITLFTNEKIKGQFLEKSEYLEDLETSTKYYKAYIVKIEKI